MHCVVYKKAFLTICLTARKASTKKSCLYFQLHVRTCPYNNTYIFLVSGFQQALIPSYFSPIHLATKVTNNQLASTIPTSYQYSFYQQNLLPSIHQPLEWFALIYIKQSPNTNRKNLTFGNTIRGLHTYRNSICVNLQKYINS